MQQEAVAFLAIGRRFNRKPSNSNGLREAYSSGLVHSVLVEQERWVFQVLFEDGQAKLLSSLDLVWFLQSNAWVP